MINYVFSEEMVYTTWKQPGSITKLNPATRKYLVYTTWKQPGSITEFGSCVNENTGIHNLETTRVYNLGNPNISISFGIRNPEITRVYNSTTYEMHDC